ncbi:hypothetical protein E2C01_032440 [Portunus trituberculatus]|uniref:Uncharacterized protein n=1 Tax=Portunus trituberculatus TaxID=210409 RepID=A0A5B7EXI2_PORTR|nr:hypothetical protein [Portunus trituberculatus]
MKPSSTLTSVLYGSLVCHLSCSSRHPYLTHVSQGEARGGPVKISSCTKLNTYLSDSHSDAPGMELQEVEVNLVNFALLP